MNLEHYRNFVEIVDAGTITAASKNLLIAQPALSNQIKKLEDTYGTKLVVRGSRKITLTDAGKILYDKIMTMLYLEDAAMKEIKSYTEGQCGTLLLGITPSAPDQMLYELFSDFHNEYPEITFEIYEKNSDQLIELLESGIIEVGLIRSQSSFPNTITTLLTIQEYMMAYYHRDHQAFSSRTSEITLSQLKDYPISISNGLKKRFWDACIEAGYQPDYMNVSSSRAISQFWASDRRTVAIIVNPESFDEGEYCCRRITSENLLTKRSFSVNKKRQLSSIATTFLTYCRYHYLTKPWSSFSNEIDEKL